MKGYILKRILRSIISVFIVVSIVITMIFTLIPRTKLLDNDQAYKKLTGDTKTAYRLNMYQKLGYLHFARIGEICAESEDPAGCQVNGSEAQKAALKEFEEKDYVIEYFRNKTPYATHDYTIPELIFHFWGNLIKIDNKNFVQKNYIDTGVISTDIEKKYYIGKDDNNFPAILCSGCEYKYQLYFGHGFPFIHQNKIRLNFGISYPTKSGMSTLTVINEGQGSQKAFMQTFPTGLQQESPLKQMTAKFKPNIDHLDSTRFTDNYADCESYYESPSMVNTSYIFGIISLIIAYALGLPAGMGMARNKGGFWDKIGVAFINFIIALPSLALIFFVRQIGATLFGLPDKFPMLGFNNVKSYLAPLFILSLLSLPGLMTWTRRYMIDQSNADYVKFAKAKGLSQREIFTKHILKNAIIPIVNGIPGSIILCISGAFITESAFAIPGMGKMLPDSINKMNNNMVITLAFIFAALSIFSVLLGDLLMTVVDPRIQLQARGGKK